MKDVQAIHSDLDDTECFLYCHPYKFSGAVLPNYTLRECIQKFQDWPPGARTANGTALCH
jgi:hypothetical protein